jgi:mono/diheme cytochrome c family protein
MKDKEKQKNVKTNHSAKRSTGEVRRFSKFSTLLAMLAVAMGVSATVWMVLHRKNRTAAFVPRPPGTLTFSKDIAPILFARCAGCHRPGQSAPFDLLTYENAKKRAPQIAEVTAKRYMPPWLPEPGYGDFANSRRLSDDEIEMIRQWVAEGTPEGSPADLPRPPDWVEGWQLGKPDLVVELARPYTLPTEGRDIYRNFVIPVPLETRRHVRAFEFNPGNSKAVHHAFVKVDPTRQSRRLDGADGQPGFSGMNVPDSVLMPDGHFMGWQPGKLPYEEPAGLAWTLQPGSDLVLQQHFRLSGKPESIQPKVGLYFTNQAPTNTCFKFLLTSIVLDIPPGIRDYVVTDDFVLPSDVQVLAVLPHAHYLCKEMQGFATLPDGTRKWLILIKNWDFNWQGDYRYAQPVFLPKGTTLSMRFTYDNSTNNIANPNNPPKRVTYGPQSTDEMAELWFQVLPPSRKDFTLLSEKASEKMLKVFVERYTHELQINPNDAKANKKLGTTLLGQGKVEEAIGYLRTAVQNDPRDDEPHYFLGLALRQQNKLMEARMEFQSALRINPKNFKAHGNLGVMFAEQGLLQIAETHLRRALAGVAASGVKCELRKAEGQSGG